MAIIKSNSNTIGGDFALNKKRNIWLIYGLVLFIMSCALAILLKSTVFIYISSLLPIFIVPLLPDLPSRQVVHIRAGLSKWSAVRTKTNQPESDLLIIHLEPGSINWQKPYLYIRLEHVPTISALPQPSLSATVSILEHDLFIPRKRGRWIGIHVPNLVERLKALPFTTYEVNRLVVRVADIQYKVQQRSAKTQTSVKQRSLGA